MIYNKKNKTSNKKGKISRFNNDKNVDGVFHRILNVINRKSIGKDRVRTTLMICVVTYTLVLSGYSVWKHSTFNTYAWDLGIFSQGMWTTVNDAEVFFNTCEQCYVESGSFFGVHFSPILYALIPLYCVLQRPETLLVIQSAVLGIAAIPLYLIGDDLLNAEAGLLFSASYLLNPATHGINCYDFHVQSLLPLLLFTSIHFYNKKRWGPCTAATLLIPFVEEHTTYLLASIAVFMLLEAVAAGEVDRDKISVSIAIVALAVVWDQMSSSIVKFFNPGASSLLLAGRHFRGLDIGDPRDIPYRALMSPLRALESMAFSLPEKTLYLAMLFAPVLFLPLRSLRALIPTLPWFTISLLSNYPPYYGIGYQYPAYVIPFIYYSAIIATRKKNDKGAQGHGKAAFAFLAANLIISLLFSPLGLGASIGLGGPAYSRPGGSAHVQSLNRVLDRIPEDASVLTQDNLFPHVSSRRSAHVLCPPFEGPDAEWQAAIEAALDSKPDYILLDPSTDYHGASRELLWLMGGAPIETSYYLDGIYLFEMNYETPGGEHRDEQISFKWR